MSAKTLKRIQRIIQETNYSPSMSARMLANKLSNIIGVINHAVSSKAGSFISDPFISMFISGMERIVRKSGYFMMLRTVEDPSTLRPLITNWNLKGIILTGLFQDEFYAELRTQRIPFVLIDSYIDDHEAYNI